MTRNIYLIGMMGSGKSVVSKLLSKKIERERVDLDALIVDHQKMSIRDIFEKEGEAHFRKIESEQLQKVASGKDLVVATGGGIVIDDANLELMRQTGTTIYLKASTDVLYSHIRNTSERPLLNVANPKEKLNNIFESRKPQYEKADYIISVDNKTPDEITEGLIELLEIEGKL